MRHRPFRLLWIGLAISVTGTQMQVWAILWHIRTLTAQPVALGGVGLARIVPVVLFSLVGGAMADVVDRRRILFVTQGAMCLLAGILAWLSFAGEVSLADIYVLTALQAAAVAFDLPARQALVPSLVPAADLPNAFSMQSIAFQIGSIAGPALTGLVMVKWGQAYTYAINAVSYLAVIVALVLMGPVGQWAVAAVGRPRPRGALWARLAGGISVDAIRDGIRFIWRQPIILSTMLLDFFATFFSSANTLMPIFARDVLNVTEVQYGWLSAAQAVGAVGAATVISQAKVVRRQGAVLLSAVVVYGLATIGFGLSPTFEVAMAALIVAGASDAVSTIIRNTVRQLNTPDHIRGRMTSINQIFFMGGPQLGEVEAGLVGQLLGAPMAVITGGIGCLVAVGWVVRRWPMLARYDGSEPLREIAATTAPSPIGAMGVAGGSASSRASAGMGLLARTPPAEGAQAGPGAAMPGQERHPPRQNGRTAT